VEGENYMIRNFIIYTPHQIFVSVIKSRRRRCVWLVACIAERERHGKF
jgi:hypothetical protein